MQAIFLFFLGGGNDQKARAESGDWMGEVWRVDMKEEEGETGRRRGGQLGGCIRRGRRGGGEGDGERDDREGEMGMGQRGGERWGWLDGQEGRYRGWWWRGGMGKGGNEEGEIEEGGYREGETGMGKQGGVEGGHEGEG